MQCIREKINLIDIEEKEIDAETLASMAVRQEHFHHALAQSNPSSLRETLVEVPKVSWKDIGGLKEVKVGYSEYTHLCPSILPRRTSVSQCSISSCRYRGTSGNSFSTLWSTPKSLRSLA